MNRYSLGEGAETDLTAIWDYIAEDSIDAADRWIATLYGAFEKLALAPGMGHIRNDLTTLAVRFWPVGDYLIVYRAHEDAIEIVAVTQGARDVTVFLSTRS